MREVNTSFRAHKVVVRMVLAAMIAVVCTTVIGCASAPKRPDRTMDDLFAARKADDDARAKETRQRRGRRRRMWEV